MVTVPSTRTFTPQQFARLCALHPEEVLELDADGHLIEMAPTGSETSARNQVLGALLWLAVRQRQLPFKVFDNSGSLLP